MWRSFIQDRQQFLKCLQFLFVSLFVFTISLSYGAPASAETTVELNTLRLGNDYSIFTLNSSDHMACKRACEKDVKCRSWTFVKGSSRSQSQCRLKFSGKLKGFKNPCCVSGVKTKQDIATPKPIPPTKPPATKNKEKTIAKKYAPPPGTFQPRRQQRHHRSQICADWAANAMNEQNENMSNRCGLRGWNWHLDYERHYGRCMGLNRSQRDGEAGQRRQQLDKCRAEQSYEFGPRRGRLAEFKESQCAYYIDSTKAQLEANERLGCGFKGSIWRRNYSRQQAWCRANTSIAVEDRLGTRHTNLLQCIARRGEQLNNPCHDFAEKAMRQNEKIARYRCPNLSADLWHGRYRRYYRWCRRHDEGQQRRFAKDMRKQMRVCRVIGGIFDFR